LGTRYEQLTPAHIEFVARQKIFFVATATGDSRISLSPKGTDSFRVLSARRIAWLNLTGSGNETAAHVGIDPRMTVMFCAFEGDPLVLRLYGRARAVHRSDTAWDELFAMFGRPLGGRQIFDLDVDFVQGSCGFGVPYFDYAGDRETLAEWAAKKGEDGLRQYWRDRNQASIDGLPTHIVDKNG
jgi:hypothetical protein